MPQFTGTSGDDVLTGTSGDDTINAGAGRDTLTGGAGSDSLVGGIGPDLIMGDDGADTVDDILGSNTIHGGAGNDVISGSGLIYAEDGDDTVNNVSDYLTVVGGLGNDWISGRGELYGAQGDDTITGGQSSIIGGEAGDDYLVAFTLSTAVGEAGADTIIGSYGSTLLGGDGDDKISNMDGGAISAGAGADTVLLLGGYYLPSAHFPGVPVAPVDVDLGDGNDIAYLSSMAGGVVRGGAGDDLFYQSGSTMSLVPLTVAMDGGRDQLIRPLNAGPVTVQGFSAGAGGDVLHLATFTPPQRLDGSPPALTEEFTSDPFVSGHLRVIQSGSDVLVQSDYDAGFDDHWFTFATLKNVTRSALTAENFGGWNPLAPERVNTPFVLGIHSNWDGNANPFLTGHLVLVSEGNDTLLLLDRNGGANEGILLARYIDTPASAITADVLGGIDPIVQAAGLASNDLVQPVDTGYSLYLFGGAGDDTLVGLGRADTLDGGSGANTIQAGGGDDVIWVRSAPDSAQLIMAGEGADTIHFSSGGQVQLAGGSDTAIIEADFAAGAPVQLGFWDFQADVGGDRLDLRPFLRAQTSWTDTVGNPFATGFVRLVQTDVATLLEYDADGAGAGAGYRQLLYMSGTQAASLTADNFFGFDPNPAANVPTARNDVLRGGEGADTFAGGAGQDSISGRGGADSISGDAGDDTLSGGAGADTFGLPSGSGMDWVNDFSRIDHDRVAAGSAVTVYQYGSDVVVDVDGGRMMLLNNDLYYLMLTGSISVTGSAPGMRTGTSTDEVLLGGSGADTLSAGGGQDTLSGGAGADLLYGGAGTDTLNGGAGADTFRLTGDSDMDWVQDFNAAEGDRVMVAQGLTWSVYQYGPDTVVDVVGGRMMILNTQLSSLPSGWIFSG